MSNKIKLNAKLTYRGVECEITGLKGLKDKVLRVIFHSQNLLNTKYDFTIDTFLSFIESGDIIMLEETKGNEMPDFIKWFEDNITIYGANHTGFVCHKDKTVFTEIKLVYQHYLKQL